MAKITLYPQETYTNTNYNTSLDGRISYNSVPNNPTGPIVCGTQQFTNVYNEFGINITKIGYNNLEFLDNWLPYFIEFPTPIKYNISFTLKIRSGNSCQPKEFFKDYLHILKDANLNNIPLGYEFLKSQTALKLFDCYYSLKSRYIMNDSGETIMLSVEQEFLDMKFTNKHIQKSEITW